MVSARVLAFVNSLQLFVIEYSWGGVASLAVPWDLEARIELPHRGQLVRCNNGLEEPDVLITDLVGAFRVFQR